MSLWVIEDTRKIRREELLNLVNQRKMLRCKKFKRRKKLRLKNKREKDSFKITKALLAMTKKSLKTKMNRILLVEPTCPYVQ